MKNEERKTHPSQVILRWPQFRTPNLEPSLQSVNIPTAESSFPTLCQPSSEHCGSLNIELSSRPGSWIDLDSRWHSKETYSQPQTVREWDTPTSLCLPHFSLKEGFQRWLLRRQSGSPCLVPFRKGSDFKASALQPSMSPWVLLPTVQHCGYCCHLTVPVID